MMIMRLRLLTRLTKNGAGMCGTGTSTGRYQNAKTVPFGCRPMTYRAMSILSGGGIDEGIIFDKQCEPQYSDYDLNEFKKHLVIW
jgi:hypothetical protein